MRSTSLTGSAQRALAVFVALLGSGGVDAQMPDWQMPDWTQARDQNPFVLASGLPLPPSAAPAPGRWQITLQANEANTEMAQDDERASLLFDAETRELRVNLAYAFDARWTGRVSIGRTAVLDGFLDAPIERFHRVFGLPNGDRGRLGTQAPLILVERDGQPLYRLAGSTSGSAPLLLDLDRRWRIGEHAQIGFGLGAKLPVGSVDRLGDSGGVDVSLSAFAGTRLGERIAVAARLGILHQGGNRLLPGLARRNVAFGGALLEYRLAPDWTAFAQYDAHQALYRDLPDFFAAAGTLDLGLACRLGTHGELRAWIGEDVPALRTTDVVLGLALRLHPGDAR